MPKSRKPSALAQLQQLDKQTHNRAPVPLSKFGYAAVVLVTASGYATSSMVFLSILLEDIAPVAYAYNSNAVIFLAS